MFMKNDALLGLCNQSTHLSSEDDEQVENSYIPTSMPL